MEVKPGYKQSEVGVIPEEWDICDLQGVCQEPITYGIVQCGPHQAGGVPYIRVSDMDGPELDPNRMLRTSPLIAEQFSRSTVKEGDLVYALRGQLGEVRQVRAEVAGANLTQGTARLSPGEKVLSSYLLWAMRDPRSIRQAETQAKGTTFREITLENLRRINILVPPISEQHTIATALGDMDALLDGLDRLIAKKRAIKQAAMQQLLTDQTRLPGFSGEWEVKRLGDHLTFLKNGVNSRAELSYSEDVRYLHYGDIHGSSRVELNPANVEMPCLPRAKASRLDRLQNGDLIFADASEDMDGVGKSVEIQNAAGIELVSGLHTIAIRLDKSVLADGFKAYIQFIPKFRAHLRQLAAGTKVYATNRTHIASAELRLPGIDEQQAISALLTDMDAEITALEARRTKTRALKQAMMQELLTGRTRLV